jgi:cytosine/adenosine deaminase-related metal-dependent hydrolase
LIILKNAYVLTFNKNNDFARYSLLINNSKVTDIADSSAKGAEKVEKWIEQYSNAAEVIDCTNKLIMPPFINSCVKSEGAMIHYLLKKRHYESAEDDLCTDLIFNYLYQELPSEETRADLASIYDYSFNKLLKSGISSFNEFSLRKDINHLAPINATLKTTGQRVSVSYPIKQDANVIRDYKYLSPAYYLTQENHLTVYDISNITELKNHNVRRLFLEVATNKEITDKFKQTFRKSIIAVLDEYGLIDENTSLINPLYIGYDDLKIITEKGANIIVCPRDLNHFTSRYFPIDDFIGHGIKFTIGTGWLGEDLLKDVRLFRNKYKELNLTSAELLLSITRVPYHLFFNGDITVDSDYGIDVNKPADLILIDLSDLRFQFFSENTEFENVCDFIIDNLTSYNVSDVILSGEFKVKDHKLVNFDDEELLKSVNQTRNRLYSAGKYNELKKRKEQKEFIQKLDLSGRDEDEIKLFSDKPEEEPVGETLGSKAEEFRIKTKIPISRQKIPKAQRSLFEEEQSQIIQSDEFQEAPYLNLLSTDLLPESLVEDDIIQIRAVDETIIKRLKGEIKTEKPKKTTNVESKIELPKNVKLKFGDD